MHSPSTWRRSALSMPPCSTFHVRKLDPTNRLHDLCECMHFRGEHGDESCVTSPSGTRTATSLPSTTESPAHRIAQQEFCEREERRHRIANLREQLNGTAPPSSGLQGMVYGPPVRTICLLRHGDRYDMAVGSDAWLKQSKRPDDSPLSDLGHKQSWETACLWADQTAGAAETVVVCSPFLRCIQTADAIASTTNSAILIEEGLRQRASTSGHTISLPAADERSAYYPRVDTEYTAALETDPNEAFPEDTLTRYRDVIRALLSRFPDGATELCLVTHSAGVVAIAAMLLGKRLSEVPAASACGLWRLAQGATGDWFTVAQDSREHLTESGHTRPWPLRNQPMSDDQERYLKAGHRPRWYPFEGQKPSLFLVPATGAHHGAHHDDTLEVALAQVCSAETLRMLAS